MPTAKVTATTAAAVHKRPTASGPNRLLLHALDFLFFVEGATDLDAETFLILFLQAAPSTHLRRFIPTCLSQDSPADVPLTLLDYLAICVLALLVHYHAHRAIGMPMDVAGHVGALRWVLRHGLHLSQKEVTKTMALFHTWFHAAAAVRSALAVNSESPTTGPNAAYTTGMSLSRVWKKVFDSAYQAGVETPLAALLFKRGSMRASDLCRYGL